MHADCQISAWKQPEAIWEKKICFANTFCNCKNKKTNLKPERIHQLLTLEKYGILYNSEPRSDI